MCQGVIISLIKFKVGRQTKKVVLTGIGSHSDLFKNNIKKLKREGWKESVSNEKIISIESNFSGWNKFTIESHDKPNNSELSILRKAYKGCAGNAENLIKHVKKIGKIDNALLNLLSAPAFAEYNKVTDTAWA